MPLVLVVDDYPMWHEMYHRQLDGRIDLISARSAEEAKRVFNARHKKLAAIALGTCAAVQPTTLHLVPLFRLKFNGPIIAVSTVPGYRQQLMQAGCSHEIDKVYLAQLLLHLFAPQQEASC
ncbi:MAG TPA: hypothetical protein VJC16_01640 [Candidatus Nanoarchaeia archaeon]|nr:hypothetical protein [Candidatus Nanoarchaeia archaeon]